MPKVYFPNYIFTLCRPIAGQRSTIVTFKVPRKLTKLDIKEYVQSVYQAEVKKVNTVILHRKKRRMLYPRALHRNPKSVPFEYTTMYKKAFVQMEREPSISYPDTFIRPEADATKKEKRKQKASELRMVLQDKFSQWDKVVESRYPATIKEMQQKKAEEILQTLAKKDEEEESKKAGDVK
jgi:ribosomal protein L23